MCFASEKGVVTELDFDMDIMDSKTKKYGNSAKYKICFVLILLILC